ncbi:MAG TPA: hypothetical protein DCL77_15115 [Prolixibacteraceae bacterium]|nr:hypothetical protein [Prolixibacteraceae bacterium]
MNPIYNLIKAYSDFPKGYDYSLLADTNDLDLYHQQLKKFYTQNPDLPDTSEQEVEEYILNEMIRNTDENQKNNKRKTKFKYNCEKYLINSFIVIFISLLLFCLNYSLKSPKRDPIEVKIDNSIAIPLNLDSKENRNFIQKILKDSIVMPKQVKTTTITPRKPTPPVSQTIKEGKDPKPKKATR